jgi:hypothetical protein
MYQESMIIRLIIYKYYPFFQPVDLLPFRIEDARRQLEIEGDFSFEALTLLREAEEERRGNREPSFF